MVADCASRHPHRAFHNNNILFFCIQVRLFILHRSIAFFRCHETGCHLNTVSPEFQLVHHIFMGIDSSCRYNGNLFLVLLRVFPDKGDDALYLVIILRFFEGISRMLRVYAQVCEFFSVKAQMAACQRSLYDYQIRRCLIFSVPHLTDYHR